MPGTIAKPRSLFEQYVRGAVVGALCFFPGFFLSLPFTYRWASKTLQTGEAQAILLVVFPSFGIGLLAAFVAVIIQLMKVSNRNR
jgi:hypothetical protein